MPHERGGVSVSNEDWLYVLAGFLAAAALYIALGVSL